MGRTRSAGVLVLAATIPTFACGAADAESPDRTAGSSITTTTTITEASGTSDKADSPVVIEPLPAGWKSIELTKEGFARAIEDLSSADRPEASFLDAQDDLIDSVLFAAYGPDGALAISELGGSAADLERESDQLVSDLAAQGVEIEVYDELIDGLPAKVSDRDLTRSTGSNEALAERRIWIGAGQSLVSVELVGTPSVIDSLQESISSRR